MATIPAHGLVVGDIPSSSRSAGRRVFCNGTLPIPPIVDMTRGVKVDAQHSVPVVCYVASSPAHVIVH